MIITTNTVVIQRPSVPGFVSDIFLTFAPYIRILDELVLFKFIYLLVYTFNFVAPPYAYTINGLILLIYTC